MTPVPNPAHHAPMETGQSRAHPAPTTDSAMARLQRAALAAVGLGGALILLWGLLPRLWPEVAGSTILWSVTSVALVTLFAGFALALLLPRLRRLERLVARDLAELECSR